MATMTTVVGVRRLEVWLPGTPVSVNGAYSRSAHGVYLTKVAREWRGYVRDVVGYEALAARFPTHERLRAATLTLLVRKQRGDADNFCKLLQDGIAAGLGVDDKIFSLGSVRREWTGNGDRAGVWVLIEATEVAEQ